MGYKFDCQISMKVFFANVDIKCKNICTKLELMNAVILIYKVKRQYYLVKILIG